MIQNMIQKAIRPHIAIYGLVNTGKSTLFNKIINQDISTISEQKGTTTDNVEKAMEISGLGACQIIDTPGFNDDTALGQKRIKNTLKAIEKTDLAIMILSDDKKSDEELIKKIQEKDIPIIYLSKDKEIAKENIIYYEKIDSDELKNKILEKIPTLIQKDEIDLTKNLVKELDTVLLLMPQDGSAPTGRIITPQVHTIRELLDKNVTVICTTEKNYISALKKNTPDLIITDASYFKFAYENKPTNVPITAFSLLFSKQKGDIDYFIESAKKIKDLDKNANILICEACTHAPKEEQDIGTVKIPKLLRKQLGENINFHFARGEEFYTDNIDMIIHCGSCMFTKKQLQNRVKEVKDKNIPMTNYGIAIAGLNGILDKIVY